MKELPILFKDEMSSGILAGRKWQTRRPVKPAKDRNGSGCELAPCEIAGEINNGDLHLCPYGQPGDRLYVKETYWAWGRWETRFDAKKGRDAWHFVDMTLECGKAYQFEQPSPIGTRAGVSPAWHKRPSLFMPRHASRITLEVTAVRVERLQDISEADARAEGVRFTDFGMYTPRGSMSVDGGKTYHPFKPQKHPGFHVGDVSGPDECHMLASGAFAGLWVAINGPDSWAANPWVWVVEFRVIEPGEVAA